MTDPYTTRTYQLSFFETSDNLSDSSGYSDTPELLCKTLTELSISVQTGVFVQSRVVP